MFPKAKYEIGFFTTISTSTTSYTDYIGDGTQCTHCTVVNGGKCCYNIHSYKEVLTKTEHLFFIYSFNLVTASSQTVIGR